MGWPLAEIDNALIQLEHHTEVLASSITAQNIEIGKLREANADLLNIVRQLSIQVVARDNQIARLQERLNTLMELEAL